MKFYKKWSNEWMDIHFCLNYLQCIKFFSFSFVQNANSLNERMRKREEISIEVFDEKKKEEDDDEWINEFDHSDIFFSNWWRQETLKVKRSFSMTNLIFYTYQKDISPFAQLINADSFCSSERQNRLMFFSFDFASISKCWSIKFSASWEYDWLKQVFYSSSMWL